MSARITDTHVAAETGDVLQVLRWYLCVDIQAVIGAYLDAKRGREWPRLQRGTNRAEYMYSRLDIRYYNHLMHKLESLSRGVACMPDRRATWTQVLPLQSALPGTESMSMLSHVSPGDGGLCTAPLSTAV